MNIAFDSTTIPSGTKKGGVTNYIINLINGLAQIDTINRYVIFIKSEDISRLHIQSDNFIIEKVLFNSKLLRLFWEQMIFPFLLRKHNVDLVHSPHYTIPFFLTRCRRVVTFHDMTFFIVPQMHRLPKRVFFRKIIPASALHADALICVSRNTAKDVHSILNVNLDKTYVVPLGLDPKFRVIKDSAKITEFKQKYKLSNDFILYLGTLEPRKNIDLLIQAYYETVKKSAIQHQLVIAGEKGWDYQKLFELVARLNISDQVIFTGFVPDDELSLLYNAADLFVYPSKYEGFGLPVLEAMACGTPVITSNVSSMPEIVKDAGILVNPDVVELSKAIGDVLNDSKIKRDLIEKGISRAKCFTWQNTARMTLDIYQKVLHNRELKGVFE